MTEDDDPPRPRRTEGPHGDFKPRIFLAAAVQERLLGDVHPSKRTEAADLLARGLTEDFDALRRAHPAPTGGNGDG